MDLERLYNEYFDMVYRFVLSISGNHHIAEEVTQEAFFKALKKIDSFRGESSVSTWLCQIARNIYYDHLKKQKRRDRLISGADTGMEDPGVETRIMRKASARELHMIIHELREPYKEVFSLRTFGELSFKEIGEIFGKSEGWSRVTYHRAKLMIKEELENESNV